MKRFVLLTFLSVFLMGWLGQGEAASLKVAPSRFIVHDVNPGKLYDIYRETGLRLTIFNDDEVSRTWVLSTHRPSERGRWEKGYEEIPDPRWCWFEKNEIRVKAKSKAYATLYLKVPDEESYYNQHWIVTLGVGGNSGRPGISLAVDIRVQIETKSNADVNAKPHGLLGLKPSMVRFDQVSPGISEDAEVVLYNNDETGHDYTITSLFDDSKTEKGTYLTHSYEAIPSSAWVTGEKNIWISPGGSEVLHLELEVPADRASFSKKWEDILLIQPDDGPARFVRVQILTEE